MSSRRCRLAVSVSPVSVSPVSVSPVSAGCRPPVSVSPVSVSPASITASVTARGVLDGVRGSFSGVAAAGAADVAAEAGNEEGGEESVRVHSGALQWEFIGLPTAYSASQENANRRARESALRERSPGSVIRSSGRILSRALVAHGDRVGHPRDRAGRRRCAGPLAARSVARACSAWTRAPSGTTKAAATAARLPARLLRAPRLRAAASAVDGGVSRAGGSLGRAAARALRGAARGGLRPVLVGASAEAAERFGVGAEQLDAEQLRARYPQLAVGDATIGLFEPDAGFVRSRRPSASRLSKPKRAALRSFAARAVGLEEGASASPSPWARAQSVHAAS